MVNYNKIAQEIMSNPNLSTANKTQQLLNTLRKKNTQSIQKVRDAVHASIQSITELFNSLNQKNVNIDELKKLSKEVGDKIKTNAEEANKAVDTCTEASMIKEAQYVKYNMDRLRYSITELEESIERLTSTNQKSEEQEIAKKRAIKVKYELNRNLINLDAALAGEEPDHSKSIQEELNAALKKPPSMGGGRRRRPYRKRTHRKRKQRTYRTRTHRR
jgi:hypothetical protein